MKTQTFEVTARGTGRLDYSSAVEKSVTPFFTPTLRQIQFFGQAWFTLPVLPMLDEWVVGWDTLQEDGTFALEASSIVMHFSKIYASIRTNHLIHLRFQRYANEADYDAGIVAEVYPEAYGYGAAELNFHRALPTKEGSVYATRFGAWPLDKVEYNLSIGVVGISAELTKPWMW